MAVYAGLNIVPPCHHLMMTELIWQTPWLQMKTVWLSVPHAVDLYTLKCIACAQSPLLLVALTRCTSLKLSPTFAAAFWPLSLPTHSMRPVKLKANQTETLVRAHFSYSAVHWQFGHVCRRFCRFSLCLRAPAWRLASLLQQYRVS